MDLDGRVGVRTPLEQHADQPVDEAEVTARFLEHLDRTGRERGLVSPGVCARGVQHDGGLGRPAADLGYRLDAAQLGHLAVEDDEVRMLRFRERDRLLAVGALGHHLETRVVPELEAQQEPYVVGVVDHDHSNRPGMPRALRCGHGSIVPSPQEGNESPRAPPVLLVLLAEAGHEHSLLHADAVGEGGGRERREEHEAEPIVVNDPQTDAGQDRAGIRRMTQNPVRA